jgi:hypothetical protein
VLGPYVAGRRLVEERRHGRHAALGGRGAHVHRWFDAEAPHPRIDDMLQEVAIVAGNFDDK